MDGEAQSGEGDFAELISHIIGQLDAIGDHPDCRPSPADEPVLRKLKETTRRLRSQPVPATATHPAIDRWLDQAVDLAPPESAGLARTIQRCAPLLHWNVAYAEESPSPIMERFWPNYTYCALAVPGDAASPPGPFATEEMALFLIVQGADVVYRRHHHPATEVYGVVAGTGRWLRGDEGYRLRPPGHVFVHAPNVDHATTTTDQPTLSWAAWLGDLDTGAVMSNSEDGG